MPQCFADRIYLERAYDLARRGLGNTAPNPPVGAVVVAGDTVIGEGYHHRAGEPHAEVNALREAGERARGATLYVSLEPCNHHGRTPPCSKAVLDAGIARVVVGTADPNPRTNSGGIATLREAGVDVTIASDADAQSLIASFARAIRSQRPFVTLKMAMSLDGYIASKRGAQQWLTGEEARTLVRELRISHDAVAVGAGTVRIDNPHLTVRPEHGRLREYVRVVFCESEAIGEQSNVLTKTAGYARTVVIAPERARERFTALANVADVVYVGEDDASRLDLGAALRELYARGITSLLCEGGPTIAGELLQRRLVDRLVWLVAPLFLQSADAVPVLAGAELGNMRGLRFDRAERLGADVVLTGTFDDV